jgi:Amino acid synthesis
MQIRRLTIVRDVIYEEGGLPACAATTRVAACAVIANPYAGQAAEDLSVLFAVGAELGHTLAKEALAQLPGSPVAYGKAAIVGVNGDIEHAAAVLHPTMGKSIREEIGGGQALIPSTQKIAVAGASIDTPLGHKDDTWSFDHIDTIGVSVDGAPRPDEILVMVALSDGGRPRPRAG